MTHLPVIVAVLLAAGDVGPPEPPPSPPVDAAPAPVPPEPPPAPAVPEPAPGEAPGEAPDEAVPAATPPEPAAPATALTVERREIPRELSFFGGVGALRLLGVSATGGQGRVAFAGPVGAGWTGVGFQLAGDLFVGETAPGLAMRSASLSVELWTDPARVVRIGAGLGVGIVGYRRVTNSQWELALASGLHAGVEARLVRWRRAALVLGVHAAAHHGDWISGAASLGLRLGLGARDGRSSPLAAPRAP